MAEPTFSVEFFPPKDADGEELLWRTLSELNPFKLDFVSVTYGAGGSRRDLTIKVTEEITARTGIPTIAHLTCVGSTEAELRQILTRYKEAKIDSILAVRGDPIGGPTFPWISTPGGFDHADQLVTLACDMGFTVGVAAFPDGHPVSAGNFQQDLDVLIEKERRGASFATTQFFFQASRYKELVERLRSRGSQMDVYAGILPITNLKQLQRMAELTGTPLPGEITERFSGVVEPQRIKAIGIDIAAELCEELLAIGVPGIHFYTMNSASSTLEVVKRIGMR